MNLLARDETDAGLDAVVPDVPREERGVSEKTRDEPRLGVLEHLLGRTDLLDLAVVDDRNAVRDGHRLLLVVRDGHRRHARLLQNPADLLAHLDPEVHVEVRERLVEEEHRRLRRERPGECDALLLATGQLVGVAVALCVEPHELQHLVDPRLPVGGVPLVEAERDVLASGEMRKQRELLEDDADTALFRCGELPRTGDDVAVQANLAAVGAVESGDQPQGRRLPTARGAEQGENLTLLDRQREVLDDRLGPEPLRDAVQFEHCLAVGSVRQHVRLMVNFT